ncbi:uncharacterized protein MONBRDRAFT_23516 [Monosiga brevicollis MX1]|uniref:Anaphase-promoting complex subunit 13 n=1 Tax=Monosiga brevicollis TaxID=81824 RepID=A9UTN0_MONBE|nr:uncharacterized protein MONBRDRAFT_23516 [Monosiga brevicollis MX1]EDQ91522.1 predicted protein [Monosiga brevicollis MX1]|eukprot:XP_001743944.1 hypothetical protein [Monosiga brevicollis MX1]
MASDGHLCYLNRDVRFLSKVDADWARDLLPPQRLPIPPELEVPVLPQEGQGPRAPPLTLDCVCHVLRLGADKEDENEEDKWHDNGIDRLVNFEDTASAVSS